MNITDYIEQQRQRINRAIEEYVIDAINPLHRHHQAAVYTIFPEGRRYRGIIGLDTYKMLDLGIDPEDPCLMRTIVGIEAIHHASLIFDDLPCMDNAEQRKGKPTTWKKYGEATAILAAEYLQNTGRSLLIQGSEEYGARAVASVRILVHETLEKLLKGQEIDLQIEKTDDEIMESMENKNSLFSLAVLLPNAMVERNIYPTLFDTISTDLATAYQLFDDLRDMSDPIITGKPVGVDKQKQTSVYCWGEEVVRRMLEERKERIMANIRQIQQDSYLEQTINYILTTPS